jgi:hypothetical protein
MRNIIDGKTLPRRAAMSAWCAAIALALLPGAAFAFATSWEGVRHKHRIDGAVFRR